MPRIQILELPTEHRGDDMTTPYLIVIDQVPRDDEAFEALRQDLGDKELAERVGARAVLCFEGTMEIPANGAYPSDTHTVDVQVTGGLDAAIRRETEETVRRMTARANSSAPQ